MLDRQNSVISILSSGSDFCRICHCGSGSGELISPCYCSGSLRCVHQSCLQRWIRASSSKCCELCKAEYNMRSKMKSIWNFEFLPMTPSEKRRLFCSAVFHSISLACVIWSLFVLIDRTIDELHQSEELEWQFWTKIVVEIIGCLGAGILFFVWGKIYFCLIRKWISFNRTFVIMDSVLKKQKPSSVTNLMNTASPVVTVTNGGGGGQDLESGLVDSGGGTEKGNLEARALLLPRVVYAPPPTISPVLGN